MVIRKSDDDIKSNNVKSNNFLLPQPYTNPYSNTPILYKKCQQSRKIKINRS